MQAERKPSDISGILDSSQGPTNIDVHSVYNTSHTGASKGILTARGNQLAQSVLNGTEAEERTLRTNIEPHMNEAVEGAERQLNVVGDAVPVLEQRLENLGSSHVGGALEKVGFEAAGGVNMTGINTQVANFNAQASSNLVTKQHELLHDGQERFQSQLNTHLEGVNLGNEALNTELHTRQEALTQGLNTQVGQLETNLQNTEHRVGTEVENLQNKLTTEAQNAETKLTGEAHNLETRVNEEANQANVALGEVTNKTENESGQKEAAAFDSKSGLVTKGTLVFQPVEFKYIGEKKENAKQSKLEFKAKVGGHSKKSATGKSENDTTTWGEPVSVSYSNQDDATLEIKKSGMFGKTVASSKIALADVINQKKSERTVQLLDKDKVVGELKVEIEFKPKAK